MQLSAPGIPPCPFVEAAGRHIIFTSSPICRRDHRVFFFFFRCGQMEAWKHYSGNQYVGVVGMQCKRIEILSSLEIFEEKNVFFLYFIEVSLQQRYKKVLYLSWMCVRVSQKLFFFLYPSFAYCICSAFQKLSANNGKAL